MEAREIISHDESRTIIELYFKLRFDFDQVVSVHKSKHSPAQIIQHIKKVFRKLILEMEYELMVAEKIKNMQLTENTTNEMFDELLNFGEVMTQDQIGDFAIYYRNRVSRVTVYQTDLICSERRLAIYNSFINYSIDHDLFRFALIQQKSTFNMGSNEMFENPLTLFPSEGLQMIYQCFSNALHSFNMNRYGSSSSNSTEGQGSQHITMITPSMEKQIRRDGRYTTPKYFGQMLLQNLKNLFLVGLFRVYKSAMRSGMKTCYGWNVFSHKYVSSLDIFDLTWKGVLLRIAIYDDPTIPEQSYISKMINGRRISRVKQFRDQAYQNAITIKTPQELGIKGGVTATGISFGKYSRVDRQIYRKKSFMLSKIKEQMAKIMYTKAKYISLIDD